MEAKRTRRIRWGYDRSIHFTCPSCRSGVVLYLPNLWPLRTYWWLHWGALLWRGWHVAFFHCCDNLGIVVSTTKRKPGWKAYYALDHGFGCGWLPYWASRAFGRLFNRFACCIWGHDDILWHLGESIPSGIVCADCCKPLDGCACKELDNR